MEGGVAGNENDMSLIPPDHSWQHCGSTFCGATVVDRKHFVPIFRAGPTQTFVTDHPRRTNQQINLARGKITVDGCRVGHIEPRTSGCVGQPVGIRKCGRDRSPQATFTASDDEVIHGFAMFSRQAPKILRITSERIGQSFEQVSKRGVIGRECALIPKLFFPWNPLADREEQPFCGVVHTMKKMIL